MSRGDSSGDIPQLIVKGIRSAFRRYERWSLGEKWLHHAPELFVSVEIAHHVMKGLKSCRVDMEASVREARQKSVAKKPGRPLKVERINGRYDILVSRKGGRPWCAIEVKSPVWGVTKGLVGDFERIASAIRHREQGASLSCGAVAFYADCAIPKKGDKSAQERLSKLGAKAESKAKCIVEKYPGVQCRLEKSKFNAGSDGDGWQAFCLFFQIRKIHDNH